MRFEWSRNEFERSLHERECYELWRVYRVAERNPSAKRFPNRAELLGARRIVIELAGLRANIEGIGYPRRKYLLPLVSRSRRFGERHRQPARISRSGRPLGAASEDWHMIGGDFEGRLAQWRTGESLMDDRISERLRSLCHLFSFRQPLVKYRFLKAVLISASRPGFSEAKARRDGGPASVA